MWFIRVKSQHPWRTHILINKYLIINFSWSWKNEGRLTTKFSTLCQHTKYGKTKEVSNHFWRSIWSCAGMHITCFSLLFSRLPPYFWVSFKSPLSFEVQVTLRIMFLRYLQQKHTHQLHFSDDSLIYLRRQILALMTALQYNWASLEMESPRQNEKRTPKKHLAATCLGWDEELGLATPGPHSKVQERKKWRRETLNGLCSTRQLHICLSWITLVTDWAK